jgi:hypothetical protein
MFVIALALAGAVVCVDVESRDRYRDYAERCDSYRDKILEIERARIKVVKDDLALRKAGRIKTTVKEPTLYEGRYYYPSSGAKAEDVKAIQVAVTKREDTITLATITLIFCAAPISEPIKVGDIGQIPHAVRVIQVLDETSCLIDLGDATARLHGYKTDKLTDGEKLELADAVEASGTFKYRNGLGIEKTVLDIRPVAEDSIREFMQLPKLPDAKPEPKAKPVKKTASRR